MLVQDSNHLPHEKSQKCNCITRPGVTLRSIIKSRHVLLRQSIEAGVCVMIYQDDGVPTIRVSVKRCEGHQATLAVLSLPIFMSPEHP